MAEFHKRGFNVLLYSILFSGRAWREKLEQAEIRKREETKELQVKGLTYLFTTLNLRGESCKP